MILEKFHVTLKGLRQAGACIEGYNKGIRALQGKLFTDEDGKRKTYINFAHKDQISIPSILENNGLDDALWALQCIDDASRDRDLRLFGVWCARQVEHLMTDQRSKDALNVAERHANGLATDEELAAAWDVAWDVASAADRAVAWAAAKAAAWAAAKAAAKAAWGAANASAGDAANASAGDAQKHMLIKMCNGEAPWQK